MKTQTTILRSYVTLTKPGIIMGNAITAVAGFLLASKGGFDLPLFCSMLSGLSLIIACACVLNNYSDRSRDEKMTRTKNRPLVKKTISIQNALIFAIFLGMSGMAILALYTPPSALLAAIFGTFVYLFPYSFAKYRSTHGTLIGSFAGAAPPVVGYTAAAGHLDAAALILFAIVALWQMPHFFAIAIFRSHEYAAASIPVFPVVKGMRATKRQILFYLLAYLAASTLPTLFGYAGYGYLAAALALGASWLWIGIQGFKCANDVRWARKMFRFSLVVITGLCLALALDATPLS